MCQKPELLTATALSEMDEHGIEEEARARLTDVSAYALLAADELGRGDLHGLLQTCDLMQYEVSRAFNAAEELHNRAEAETGDNE